MIKAVIFGGTTEGRRLCEFCAANNVDIVYCVATEDGARLVHGLSNVDTHIGRLNDTEIAMLLKRYEPCMVIDATHPYAKEVSKNIANACDTANIRLVRVKREHTLEQGCLFFNSTDELLFWLEKEQGNVFVTTGSSAAKDLAKLKDFNSRVWLRILPNINSLQICLEAGFHPERLICMQGPFSEEFNVAMFKNANAKILVTKASGEIGGFPEKLKAAKSLGMITAVISKPEEDFGVPFEEAVRLIMELDI